MSLGADLAALKTMSTAQLKAEWRRVVKTPAPPAFTPDLLARGIAYRMQEKLQGGLSSSARRELARLGKQLVKTGDIRLDDRPAIKPGTRLIRAWHGVTHPVEVLVDGYLYQDRRYSSLSQIAEHITGTRWSGPRFFGLKRG